MSALTPNQLNKIIYGETSKSIEVSNLVSTKKRSKPNQVKRKPRNNDLNLLLECPYSTTAAAYQLPTPAWFTSTQKVDVSVIVPLYGSFAESLIDSIDLSSEELKFELIFVDDNSSVNCLDNVFQKWNQKKSELKGPVGKLFQSEITQGRPACCNIGAEKSNAEFLVFLDPDAKMKQGWLRTLIRMLRKPEIGVAAGLQIDGDEFVNAGAEWDWASERFNVIANTVFKGLKITRPFKIDNCPKELFEAQEREVVSSRCMAVRRKDFLNFGGFSANLKSSDWADADLCTAYREKGMKVMIQPNCLVKCKEHIKFDKEENQGRVFYLNKWSSSGRLDALVEARRQNSTQIDTIFIRRRAAHGDVLMAAAVAPALKKKFPQSTIVFSTQCPEVLLNNPWIDKVQDEPTDRQFQLYINLDMAYEYKPYSNILDCYAETAGVKVEDCQMHLHTEPFELPLKDYVVIHAGKTLWAGRNWSTLKFDSLSKKLKEKGHNIVCVGTLADHKTSVCDFDIRGKTNIHQLASVIKNSKFFIGIDSFPMHIAQTFNIPGSVFFGSILPESRLIRSNIKAVVAEGLDCLGCHHKKSTPCTSTVTCDVGIQDCVNNVSVDLFLRTIQIPE